MAGHTEPNENYQQVMEEKRVGLLSHLIGVCEFPSHVFYKQCHHPTKYDRMYPGILRFDNCVMLMVF